jgi:hypothetical protein
VVVAWAALWALASAPEFTRWINYKKTQYKVAFFYFAQNS